MADKFFIAPFDKDSGLQRNVEPWLIPDSAFEELFNAYVFRGRIRKRFGSRWVGTSQLSSRVGINLGNTPGPLNLPLNSLRSGATSQLQIGQIFSINGAIFTVNQLGAGVPTLSPVVGVTVTINSTVNPNTVTVVGEPAGQAVYWYPALPIMGLLTYETHAIDNDPTIVFDTEFAYQYSNITGGFERLAAGVSIWQGSDSQFFWGANWSTQNAYQPALFVTNFDELDPNFMRYWEGTIWTVFNPQIDAVPNFLNNARMLVIFHNRLIALNTWEGPNIPGQQNFVNRARFAEVGNPLDPLSWRVDIMGHGNFVDASTTESIVSAQFLKDRLIVFFEKSTWELVYQGNNVEPFRWQKINTELGADSTFSQVPFDKVVLGVDNIGIHACTGQNVDRIDDKIPDEVFSIHQADTGIERVYGIRDYKVEQVYWTFPSADADDVFPFPDQVLVYNYKTGTWAINHDTITAFGYIYEPPNLTNQSTTWSSTTITWSTSERWNDEDSQVNFRAVAAGNQEGFVFIIDADEPTNASVLQVTDFVQGTGSITLTVINHNLRDGDFIYLEDLTGTGNINDFNNKIYKVFNTDLPDTFDIAPDVVYTGVYSGGGTIATVSKIEIRTKQYNFYAEQNRNAYIPKVDFMVDATAEVAQSALTVEYFISSTDIQLLGQGLANGVTLGNNLLETFPYPIYYPYETQATRLWRPVNLQADGECIQLRIFMDDPQMLLVIENNDGTFTGPTFVDFQMHVMCFTATPTTARLQ